MFLPFLKIKTYYSTAVNAKGTCVVTRWHSFLSGFLSEQLI